MSDTKAAIRASTDLFEQHIRDGDAAALVRDYYVAEPFVVPPDLPLVRDPKAIEAFFAETMKAVSDCRLEPHEIREYGDIAIELGEGTLTMKEEGAAQGKCRYLIVWKRTSEGWKVETDFFSYGPLL
jgi:ketosteroid isomerase-like protein